VVDGKEGGTGAAPVEFTDHIGVPLREGLLFVHNTLVGLNLRDKIKLGASGKIVSAFDIASVLAIGADWANSARGFMFAIGCIQSQSCHTNKCPTGVATQDPLRQRALVVPDKAQRVLNFHRNTLRPWPKCSRRRAWNIRRSWRPSTWCGACRRPRSSCSRRCMCS
jgi:glutamate synthase domain-containing protein 2